MANFILVTLISLYCVSGSVAESCSGGYKGDPANCSKYYQCVNGNYVSMSCGAGLNWNSKASYCDWPATAGCTTGTAPAPAPAPVPVTAAPQPATSSSGALISQAQFQCAAQTKAGNPASSYYTGFISSLPKALITDKTEAAKFLAHATWETVGFQYTKEVYCQTNDCRAAYPVGSAGGRADKVYYGRGMLQLTWDYNYAAASKDLYGDDRLIQNPEQVADNPAIGWDTAAWFWKTNVHANSGTFGGTLKAINGALECDGGSHAENRILRFNHYKQVLQCLGLSAPADSDGYCHA